MKITKSMSIILIAVIITLPPVYAAENKQPAKDRARNMVLIPAGSFLMGRDEGRQGWSMGIGNEEFDDEFPRHEVYVDAFYIDKYEVTNRQFREFVRATGYVTRAEEDGYSYINIKDTGMMKKTEGAGWDSPGGPGSTIDNRLDHPVVHISWEDAKAYADWAGKRLPTEAEWERAARGNADTIRFWGDNLESAKMYQNFYGEFRTDFTYPESILDGYFKTAPAGSFYPNAFGIYDTAGNAAEWAEDWYRFHYFKKSPGRNPPGPASGSTETEFDNKYAKVVKGGYWYWCECYTRPANREGFHFTHRTNGIGFRLALDAGAVSASSTDALVMEEAKSRAVNTSTSKAIAVAAGGDHTVVVKADGTVWSFGENKFGQLGNGIEVVEGTDDPPYNLAPVKASGIKDAAAARVGWGYTLVLLKNGTAAGMGRNDYGQLSNNLKPEIEFKSRAVTFMVLGDEGDEPFSGITDLAVGVLHAVILDNNKNVWTIGFNDFGQLGNGSTSPAYNPVKVSGLTDIIAIGTGPLASYAVKKDGTVWAWGSNAYGKLGRKTAGNILTPVKINGLSGIVAVDGGRDFTLALKKDGTVWALGRNDSGQLGNGTGTNSITPVRVKGLAGVIAISAGLAGAIQYTGGRAFTGKHALALKSDGTVWAWGNNFSGHLGDRTMQNRNTPVQVTGLSKIIALSAGADHNIALRSDGTIWTWGANNFGKLGDGNNWTKRYSPVQVIW